MTLPIPFIHRWQRMQYGLHGMNARECRLCGRFEVYGFGAWHRSARHRYDNVRPLA